MYDANEDLKKAFSAFGFVLLTAGLLCRVIFEIITIGSNLRTTASVLAYCGLLFICTIGVGLFLDKLEVIFTYRYHRTLKKTTFWIVDALIVLLSTLLLAYDFGLIININIMGIVITVILILVTGCIGVQINKIIFDKLDKEVDKASAEYVKRKEESVIPKAEG